MCGGYADSDTVCWQDADNSSDYTVCWHKVCTIVHYILIPGPSSPPCSCTDELYLFRTGTISF